MKEVFVRSVNIISSLGLTAGENFHQMRSGISGLKPVTDPLLHPSQVQVSLTERGRIDSAFAALVRKLDKRDEPDSFTKLEKMIILSAEEAFSRSGVDIRDPGLLPVISTTKGNIDLLEDRYRAQFDHKRIFLWDTARRIRDFLGFRNDPMIVSNACISGSVAIMIAARQIQTGNYEHAIVTGADIVSEFVVSGFMSFQALSPEPCRPFDLNRKGLNIGEGAGSMILSSVPPPNQLWITVSGGATTNDANHISGPSRTGEELAHAIRMAIREARIPSSKIGYISAHGTATPYNDEMESKAIGLVNMQHVPLNSLKGYWGHTLGAAGLLESVALVHSLAEQELFRSEGFSTPGVPVELNIITGFRKEQITAALKTASGFGGCNAALVFIRK